MFSLASEVTRPWTGLIPVLPLVLFPLLACETSAAGKELLLDDIVASVNTAAITRSQVIQETRIILVEKGRFWSGRLSAELLEKITQRLIGKELIYQEMERTGSAGKNHGERLDAQSLLISFKRNFPSEDGFSRFLKGLGMSEVALAALLLHNARIEAFMERRLKLLSQATDDEIEQEIQARRKDGRLANDKTPNIRELRDFVRQSLEKEKYKKSLADWLSRLSERNRVLRLVTFTKDIGPLVFPGREKERLP